MSRMQIRLRFLWILASGVLLAGVSFSLAQAQSHAVVVKAARRAFSPPLSQMAPLPPPSSGQRLITYDDRMRVRRPFAARTGQDAALQASPDATPLALAPLSTNSGLNILGLGTDFPNFVNQVGVPPDTNLAVGPTQIVQFVNDSFAVFNKSNGSLALGPVHGNTLWQALGAPCSTNPNLDEIAQFDKLANRWVMLMPDFSDLYLCIAVSTTSDAVNGGWTLYAFPTPVIPPPGCNCSPTPDYPKLAVWPDGYYISYNEGWNGSYIGAEACVVDRNSVLNGAPQSAVTMQCFSNTNTGTTSFGSMLPADLDGTTPPPSGSPGYFLNFDGNDQSLDLWQLHVDWTTHSNSTWTGPTNVPVAAFTEACGETVVELNYTTGDCIPQLGTTQGLDSYGDRLMYRLAYRNFGDHQALVANHTVQVPTTNGQTGIRWYELRDTGSGFGVYQQGTYAPDSSYRWMGSVAMDGAGEIALGYSVSDSTMSPSIRYTGRVPTDPSGQMETEIDILSQPIPAITRGSMTNTFHWADYSSMAIDPTDDCTFWYTTEYVPTTGSNWDTRIASFSFPSCKSAVNVSISGTGIGTVTSTPAGINCPGTCSSTFFGWSSVTLAATPASGSGFDGWSGACSGTAACTFTITSDQTAGASFSPSVPGITVSPTPATATVSAGGVATFTLTVGSVGGFSNAVTLSCSAPTAQGVKCSLPGTSVTPPFPATVSLTVTTTGPSAALTLPPTTHSHSLYAAWIGFPALALVGIGTLGRRSSKRRLAGLLVCTALLGSVALQMACGSNNSTGSKNGGTPAGTYTVTINATSGSIQGNSSVSVTVQ